MRKGRDGEWKKWKEKKMENGKWKMENNGENSGPLTSLPVDRLWRPTATPTARAKNSPLALLLYVS